MRQQKTYPVPPLLFALALSVTALYSGAVFADVQVLQIQDANLAASATSLPDAAGGAGVGKADSFCVVNTLGRGVRLTFTSSNPNGGVNPALQNPLTGATINYRLSVSLSNGSLAKLITVDAAGAIFDVPASAVVTSTAACPSAGNVTKWITLTSPLPSSGSWSDQVSIKATPL